MLVAVVIVTGACLPVFAPNIRAAGVHAGVSGSSDSPTCMGCHTSERDAMALGEPTEAPIVADWMLAEPRTCVDCHRARARSGRAGVDRLPSLAKASHATH